MKILHCLKFSACMKNKKYIISIFLIFSFLTLFISSKEKIKSIKENHHLTGKISDLLDMELNEFLK